ncbi:DJ-1/PfpI family protein [Candidatus Sumerlaeota bacterium]|nr:DJ-1/PfpI family protein [Candidatus Sumerlaeota bacterium]
MGNVLCFVYNEMADFEATLVLHLVRTRGKRRIVTIAYDREPVRSQAGLTYLPDATLGEALEMDEVEALILPGGPIGEQRPELTELIRKIHGEGGLLAAICFAPQFLGRAGILDDHSFTTSCSEENIEGLGVLDPFPRRNFVDRRVVRDANVLTAQGRAFVDFAFGVCDYLHAFDSPAKMEAMHRDIKAD